MSKHGRGRGMLGRRGKPTTDSERILGQIARGEIRADTAAAREIAQRIEDQGGFWGPRKDGTR